MDDVGGPWLGLIISRAVGNAVVRHRVARRLRSAFDALTSEWPAAETFVVVRARSSAADRSSIELRDQLVAVTTHRRVRALSVGSPHLAPA